MLVKLFSLSLLPLFSGARRIWHSVAKPRVWGQSPLPLTDFYGFLIKNTYLSTLFIEKGRTVPAVSAVSNGQYKNILVGLPKSLDMSKIRSLAKINERKMQLY